MQKKIVEIYGSRAIRFNQDGELDCFMSRDSALMLVERGLVTRRAPDMTRLEFAAEDAAMRGTWAWLDALLDEEWSDAS